MPRAATVLSGDRVTLTLHLWLGLGAPPAPVLEVTFSQFQVGIL